MNQDEVYQLIGYAYCAGMQEGMSKQAGLDPALVRQLLRATGTPEGWQADELSDMRHGLQELLASDAKNDAASKELYDALLNRMTPENERASFAQQMLNHADGVSDIAGRPRTNWTEFGDLLGSEGKGTAIRGLGGAGLGYLLGDKLGNHGLLGAALGGAAGLTPEIMKYTPKAIDTIKDLFSKKANAATGSFEKQALGMDTFLDAAKALVAKGKDARGLKLLRRLVPRVQGVDEMLRVTDTFTTKDNSAFKASYAPIRKGIDALHKVLTGANLPSGNFKPNSLMHKLQRAYAGSAYKAIPFVD